MSAKEPKPSPYKPPADTTDKEPKLLSYNVVEAKEVFEGKTLEERYIVIKRKGLKAETGNMLLDYLSDNNIATTDAVVIEPHHPGYMNAVNAVLHGRICKQGNCCSCKPEDRDACFDWVMV